MSEAKTCKCEMCNGTGQRSLKPLFADMPMVIGSWNCEYCNGTGKRELWYYTGNSVLNENGERLFKRTDSP